MIINQLYTKCLAQGAYYIESNGEVAIIDPLREVDQYIEMAKENNAKIKYVFETHFHADFVSGHVTLGKKTGASIVFGPNANPTYDVIIAKDNQEFKVGDLTIKALHTPGHTMESTTYLLLDKDGKEHAVFTGDTLFIGDVGRPDLAQKGTEVTQEDLAGILFDSLRTKIIPLPNNVIVYPGHGAGSACGKSMSKETVGTLGDQKEHNYALRADMTKEEFVKELTDGLSAPPAYFPLNVKLNKEGYEDVNDLIMSATKPLNPSLFNTAWNETPNAIVLDVRNQKDFVEKHIKDSLFIGIDGGFAPWVGAIIKDINTPILLVLPEGRLEETVKRLSRVGFDNVLGYLEGGIEAWEQDGLPVDAIESIQATEFEERINEPNAKVFDVRKTGEFEAEHVEHAEFTPLSEIENFISQYPSEGKHFVYCGGGYRSVIAASILKQHGVHNIIDVKGGYGAIKKTDLPRTNFVCPSTIK